MANLLEIKNLNVDIEKKHVIDGVNLVVNPGETHVLMGPNGAGKSTLGYTIMGNPRYTVSDGKIFFDGEDITELGADKRAAKGIFLSFQAPLEVPGISLESFVRTALQQKTGERVKLFQFQKQLKETRLECGIFGRRAKKERDFAAFNAFSQARDSRRNGQRA